MSEIDKENKRKVIIYTNYPAYRVVTKEGVGKKIYLMETFALELAKPGQDEQIGIEAYWEKVNNVLAIATRELLKKG